MLDLGGTAITSLAGLQTTGIKEARHQYKITVARTVATTQGVENALFPIWASLTLEPLSGLIALEELALGSSSVVGGERSRN